MVISNSRRFIFFHIPKSGGTSITELLDSEVTATDIILGATPIGESLQTIWSDRFGLGKHSIPTEFKRIIGADSYKTFKKFIVVRDPVERLISAFDFLMVLISQKPVWFVNSTDFSVVRKWNTLADLLQSDFLNAARAKPPSHSTDIERFFLPQTYYWDHEEAVHGRFLFFPLRELKNSTTELCNHGLLSEAKHLPRSNQIAKQNLHPAGDIDQIREFARDFYREDYLNFFQNK